jgi:cation diffusion facilitator family transporter
VNQSGSLDRRDRTKAIRRVLIVVLVLNVAVAVAKLGYGLRTGSVALSADGVQSLLDGLANVVGLIGIAIAARPPDQDHPYGHERYETLASMAIAVLMAAGVFEIVQSAVEQLREGTEPAITPLSFAILAATMAINASVSLWERREARRLPGVGRRPGRIRRRQGGDRRGRRRDFAGDRADDRLGGLEDRS